MPQSIPQVLEDLRQGKMIILVDDEDRENEGDLVVPAEMASPEAVNFRLAPGFRHLIRVAHSLFCRLIVVRTQPVSVSTP